MGLSNSLAADYDLSTEVFYIDNVIQVEQDNGTLRKKQQRPTSVNAGYRCNKVRGKSSEVYPFKDREEVNSIILTMDKHINDAKTKQSRQFWCRNKLIFKIGINVGLRGSDLCSLKWSNFFYDNGELKEFENIQPIKTRDTTGKYVKIYFNENVKQALYEYLEQYPYQSLDDYVFASRKKNKGHITRDGLGKMLKTVAKESGIRHNVNSHSLRKTYGYTIWHNSPDRATALVKLQAIFGHASLRDTQKYIGIQDEEIKDVFHILDESY